MKIVVYSEGGNPDAWLAAIGQHIPQAHAWKWEPGAPQADYALVWRPPQLLLDEQGAGLKAIFNMGAGVDALLALKLPQGVPVVRLEDAGMSVQMAEYVCHAVIDHFRGLDHYRSQQRAGEWRLQPLRSRADYPVGVMGLGVLGDRVAKSVAQFDFPVRGWSRSPKHVEGVQTFHGADQFADFLQGTRILVNLLPLTPETENIINTKLLNQLQRGAYIINVARGQHLVDADLLAVIASGQVAGAMLDVFRTEPLPGEHPFWRCPQISITPHGSARTLPEDTLLQILQKLQAFAAGHAVTGVVYADRGY
ncbi:MAG: glyoxylate/hydroxypyruvate reductase A [Comamonas sp.]